MKKRVCLFGLCHASEVIIDRLAADGFCAFCILDNSEAKQGMTYNGVPVKKPETVLSAGEVTVIIASRFSSEMEQQLLDMGFSGEIIKVGDYNSFEEFSLDGDVFGRKLERASRGIDTLEEIKRDRKDVYFVCPYNALGDVYQAMSLIPAYTNKHNLKTYSVIVTGDGCGQVAEIFGIKPTLLSQTQMDELVQAIIFMRDTDFFIAHHDRPYTNHLAGVLTKKHINFHDLYRSGVFALSAHEHYTLSIPTSNKIYQNNGEIIPDRTVIIAPYAKSVSNIPLSFWEETVRRKIREGFRVLTNTVGGEEPIAGTEAITIPITKMISATEQAGFFIGVRSGLCDVLITAKCNKTVIFPNSFYSFTDMKVSEFFALDGWETIVI